jgi:hypothetical protein
MDWTPPASNDPFENPEFVRLRWDQRAQLLLVEDGTVEYVVKRMPMPREVTGLPLGRDRWVEAQLRAFGKAAGERASAFLATQAQVVSSRSLFLFLNQLDSPTVEYFQVELEVAGKTVEESHQAKFPGPESGIHASVVQFIVCLLLADVLANDGYHDPRVMPQPLEPREP